VLRQIALDWHELAFIGALAFVTPCLVTVAPALATRRVDLAHVVNMGTARTGAAHTRARQALVVAQLALAVMLTIVGSLVARSALELLRVPIGFDASKLVTFVLALDEHSPNVADRRAAVREIERLIESRVGLVAGALERYPVASSEAATPIAVDQFVLGPGESGPSALVGAADSRGLSALGVPVIAGRTFTNSEVDSGASIALISLEAARRYFGDAHSALGRRLTVGLGDSRREYQVVGVMGDVRYRQLVPRVWVPLSTPQRVSFVVRSNDDLARAASEIRSAAQRVAPDVPVESLEPYQTAIDRRTGGERVAMGMLVSCAALVLLFAATGLYGLVALSVNMRRAEFGTRFALGARVRDVIAMVIGQAFVLLAVGFALGISAGLLAANAIRRLLYGVTPFDPITLLFVVGLLTLVTVAASVVPALRAARVDVVEALRAE
jgi:putative ABC transport system permease protein